MMHAEAAHLEERWAGQREAASQRAARAAEGELSQDMDHFTDWLAGECMQSTHARGDWLCAMLARSPAALASAAIADLLQVMTLCDSATPAQRNLCRIELRRRYRQEREHHLAERAGDLAAQYMEHRP